MRKGFDVIVIGAGSVGVPIAFFLAKRGVKVLVLDKNSAVGQGQNKSAIGGVRATHSEPAKIVISKRSLDIFKNWKEIEGDDIGWKEGGYLFPVYDEELEFTLKRLLLVQKSYKLNIDWVGPEIVKELVPGINAEGLRGGVYSPEDGQVSPLKAIVAMERGAKRYGATFIYKEEVIDIIVESGKVKGVVTNKDQYYSDVVVNAGGADAREVGEIIGIDIPVYPESHEAGISAPVAQFLKPLIVDLRKGEEGKTANFYFGQNEHGSLIFCYTPLEPFIGTNRESLSEFMPIVARRLIRLIPRLKNLLIRRVWRGLYPMTPDGSPIIDKVREVEGFYLAVGMCGQGFMMGPGVGLTMSSLIVDGKADIPENLFQNLSFYRDFYASTQEKLK